MRVALGLDIGTTAVKAVALDDEGRVVARAAAAHDLMTPHPGWAEGDPGAWWANAVACVRRVGQEVSLAEVAAVGVSGMVPALVVLGAGHRLLRPSIQQNDGRTGEEIAQFRARLDAVSFCGATGQPFSQQLIDRGARSALWRQIVADVLGRPVAHAPGADHGSAHGVARVAGVAAGLWGWESGPRAETGAGLHEPAAATARTYRELYGVYRDLYARLAPAFAAARGARDGASGEGP